MQSHLMVSVIIPTHNRKASLLRTLDSLSRQTLPTDSYEVIVVDDGSVDGTAELATQEFPFPLRVLSQVNSGATTARNHGAAESCADTLLFIDDDVTVSPQALGALCAGVHLRAPLVMGTLMARCSSASSLFTRLAVEGARDSQPDARTPYEQVHFAACNTQLLAVGREAFFELGMLRDPTGGKGWPNWDDVEFGYRAHLRGYPLLRSTLATGEHWDYALADPMTSCRRWQRAAESAVWLFQMHPALQAHIPMFRDKAPVKWGEDSPRLVARKLARGVASSPLVLGGLEKTAALLERRLPSAVLLRPLYRWMIGGYLFRGFREGLRRAGRPVP